MDKITSFLASISQQYQNSSESLSITIISIILMPVFGLILRITLSKCGQTWSRTYHHTLSFVLLPLITFFITRAIAGNVVLALGMVGALSIVRFRTPVRNPLELIMYFTSISIGIVGSVNIIYSLVLVLFVSFIIFSSKQLDVIIKKKNLNLYSISFTEGEAMHSVELNLNQEEKSLTNNSMLIQEIVDYEKNIFFYRFISNNKKNLVDFIEEFQSKNKKNIKNINKSYVS